MSSNALTFRSSGCKIPCQCIKVFDSRSRPYSDSLYSNENVENRQAAEYRHIALECVFAIWKTSLSSVRKLSERLLAATPNNLIRLVNWDPLRVPEEYPLRTHSHIHTRAHSLTHLLMLVFLTARITTNSTDQSIKKSIPDNVSLHGDSSRLTLSLAYTLPWPNTLSFATRKNSQATRDVETDKQTSRRCESYTEAVAFDIKRDHWNKLTLWSHLNKNVFCILRDMCIYIERERDLEIQVREKEREN